MRTFKSLSDFYTSREWDRFRQQLILERLNSRGETIDEHTGNVIVNRNDIVLHHIKPLTLENVNDANITLNPDNLRISAIFFAYEKHISGEIVATDE